MKSIDDYVNLSTSLYKTKPKYKAWLETLLTPFHDCATLLSNMYSYFDLDSATGVQLDYLGQLIGQTRIVTGSVTTIDEIVADIDAIQDWDTLDTPTGPLDDDTYRFLLKAKVIMNTWDGTIPSLYQKWESIFSGTIINIYDNQDMSMTITLGGNITNIKRWLIVNGYIVPRPAGVRVNYYFGPLPIFGYGLDNTIISGYNKGHWFKGGTN